MKRLKEFIVIFGIGGNIYGLIEILFRGHTHWTMFTAGGLIFYFLYIVFNIICDNNILKNGLIGAIIITTAEYIIGCIVNIGLDMRIWDYSHKPLNLFGQICPAFSLAWFTLSIPASLLAFGLRQRLR